MKAIAFFFDVVQRFVLFIKGRRKMFVFSTIQTFFLIYRNSCTDQHFPSINSNDPCEVCAPLPKQGLQVRRRGMG